MTTKYFQRQMLQKKISQSNYTAINLNMVRHIPQIKILLSCVPTDLPLASAGLSLPLSGPGVFSVAPFCMNWEPSVLPGRSSILCLDQQSSHQMEAPHTERHERILSVFLLKFVHTERRRRGTEKDDFLNSIMKFQF